MKSKKLWLLVGVTLFLICVVAVATVYIFNKKEFSESAIAETVVSPWPVNPSLVFTHGQCDESIDPFKAEMLGVRDVSWRDDSTLFVRVHEVINCGEDILSGDYELASENNLVLKYQAPLCGGEVSCARCVCAHELTYTISDIERKEYNILLNRIP